MIAVYGDEASSYYQAKFWVRQFKWGRESTEDDSYSGRPVEASSEEKCRKGKAMILEDRQSRCYRDFSWHSILHDVKEFMPHKTITGDTSASTMKAYETQSKRNAMGSCQQVCCYFTTMRPLANHKLRSGNAASQSLTIHPTVQTWLPVITFSFGTWRNFCVGNDFLMIMQSKRQQEVSFYSEGIRSTEAKWNKCVEVQGDYIEK
ncbi:protein GVQW3 [Bufo bufo]|uniref:protein GVQW3 n=1 Tax=Bufo bufo TaxID=8384 RepID=UPI001ABE88CE|nr:protein GVQW3 [Bufo bufo]